MLRKDVYPYEYMDGWERFNETSLLDEEAFNSKLNLEDCTDKDYAQYKEVFKEFELKTSVIIILVCSIQYIIACRCIWKS